MYGHSKGMYKTSNNVDLVDGFPVRKDVQVLVLESASESTVDSGLECPLVPAEAIRQTSEQNATSPEYQITVVPNSGNNAFLVRRLPESGKDMPSTSTHREAPHNAGNIFLGTTERRNVHKQARSDNDIKQPSNNDGYILTDETDNLQDSRRMLMFLKQFADKRDMRNVEAQRNAGSHRSLVSEHRRQTLIPVIPVRKQRNNESIQVPNRQVLNQCFQRSNFVAKERTKIIPRMARLASLKCIRYDNRPLRAIKARFQKLRPVPFNRQCSGYDDDNEEPNKKSVNEKKSITIEENVERNDPQPPEQPAEARNSQCVCKEGVVCSVSQQQYNEEEEFEEAEYEEYEECGEELGEIEEMEEFEEMEEAEEIEEIEESAKPEPTCHGCNTCRTSFVQDTEQCNENDYQNINQNPIRSSHTCDCMGSAPAQMQYYDYCTAETCGNQQQQNRKVLSQRSIQRSRNSCECPDVTTKNISSTLKASDYCVVPSNHSNQKQTCQCNENAYYLDQSYPQTYCTNTYATPAPQYDYCTNETCCYNQNDCNFQTCTNRSPKSDWNINQSAQFKQIPLQKSGQSCFSQPARSCTSQSCNKRVRHDDQCSREGISNNRSSLQGSQTLNNRSFDKRSNISRHKKCCDCTDCDGTGYAAQKKPPTDQGSPNQSNHSGQNQDAPVQLRRQTSQKCDCNYYKDSDLQGIMKGRSQSNSFQSNNACKCGTMQQRSDSRVPCNKRSCTSRHSKQSGLYSRSNVVSKSNRSVCPPTCSSSHSKHYSNRNVCQNQSCVQSQNNAVSRALMQHSRNAYEHLTNYEPCTNNICPQRNNLVPFKSGLSHQPCTNDICPQQPCTNEICQQQPCTNDICPNHPCTNADCSQHHPHPCTNSMCSQHQPHQHLFTNQNCVPQQFMQQCTNSNAYPQNEYAQGICNSCGQQGTASYNRSATRQQQADDEFNDRCNESGCPLPVAQDNVFARPYKTAAVNEISERPCRGCEMAKGANATCSCKQHGAKGHTMACRFCKVRNRILGKSKKANKDKNTCVCNQSSRQQQNPSNRQLVRNQSNDSSDSNYAEKIVSSQILDGTEAQHGASDGKLTNESVKDCFQNVPPHASSKLPEYECVPECSKSVCVPECSKSVCVPDCKLYTCEAECIPPEPECNLECADTPNEECSMTDFPQSEEKIKRVYDYCGCNSNNTYSTHMQRSASSRQPTSSSKRFEPAKGQTSCVCSSSKSESSSKSYDLKKKNVSQSCECLGASSSQRLSQQRLRAADFCDIRKKQRKGHAGHQRKKENTGTCMCAVSTHTREKETQSEKRCKCSEVTESHANVPEWSPPKAEKEKKSCKCNEEEASKFAIDEDSSDYKLKARQYCNDGEIAKSKPKKDGLDMSEYKEAKHKSKKRSKCKEVKDKDSNEDIPSRKNDEPKHKRHKCKEKNPECQSDDDSLDNKLKASQYCKDQDYSSSDVCSDEDTKKNGKSSKKKRYSDEKEDFDIDDEEKPKRRGSKKKNKEEDDEDEGQIKEKRKSKKCSKCSCKDRDADKGEDGDCPIDSDSDHMFKAAFYCDKEKHGTKKKCSEKKEKEEEPEVKKSENSCNCQSGLGNKQTDPYKSESCVCAPFTEAKKKSLVICESRDTCAKKTCFEKPEEIIKGVLKASDFCTHRKDDSNPCCDCISSKKSSEASIPQSTCNVKEVACTCDNKEQCTCGQKEDVSTCNKNDVSDDICTCVKKPQPKPESSSRKVCCRDCRALRNKKKSNSKPPNEFHDCAETTDMSNLSLCRSGNTLSRSEICDENCIALKHKRSRSVGKSKNNLCDCNTAARNSCFCYETNDESSGVERCFNTRPRSKSGTCCKSFWDSQHNKVYDRNSTDKRSISDHSEDKLAKSVSQYESQRYHSNGLKSKTRYSVEKCPSQENQSKQGSYYKRRSRNSEMCDPDHNERSSEVDRRQNCDKESYECRSENHRSQSIQRSNRGANSNCSAQTRHSRKAQSNQSSTIDKNFKEFSRSSEVDRHRSRQNSDKESSECRSANHRSQSIHRSNKDAHSNCSSQARHSRKVQSNQNSTIDKNYKVQRSHNSCYDRRSIVKGNSHSDRNSVSNFDKSSMCKRSSSNKPSTSKGKKCIGNASRINSSDDDGDNFDDDDEDSIEVDNYHFQKEITSSCCSHRTETFLTHNCDSDACTADYQYESDSKEIIISKCRIEKTSIVINKTRSNFRHNNNIKLISNIAVSKEMEVIQSNNFDIEMIERSNPPPRNPNNVFLEDYKDPKKSKKTKTPVGSDANNEHPPTFKSTVKDSVRSMGGFCNKRNRNRRRRRNPELNPPRPLNTDEALENVTNTDASEQVRIIFVNENWAIDSSAASTAGGSIHTVRSQRSTRPRSPLN